MESSAPNVFIDVKLNARGSVGVRFIGVFGVEACAAVHDFNNAAQKFRTMMTMKLFRVIVSRVAKLN